MYSWVRYSVAAYVGLLLAGSLMMSGRKASAEWAQPEAVVERHAELAAPRDRDAPRECTEIKPQVETEAR
jgi:hypothetical protein